MAWSLSYSSLPPKTHPSNMLFASLLHVQARRGSLEGFCWYELFGPLSWQHWKTGFRIKFWIPSFYRKIRATVKHGNIINMGNSAWVAWKAWPTGIMLGVALGKGYTTSICPQPPLGPLFLLVSCWTPSLRIPLNCSYLTFFSAKSTGEIFPLAIKQLFI